MRLLWINFICHLHPMPHARTSCKCMHIMCVCVIASYKVMHDRRIAVLYAFSFYLKSTTKKEVKIQIQSIDNRKFFIFFISIPRFAFIFYLLLLLAIGEVDTSVAKNATWLLLLYFACNYTRTLYIYLREREKEREI